MYNDILVINGRTIIHGYGLMITIGVLLAVLIAVARAKKKGMDGDFIYDLVFVLIVFGVLGGKILFWITDLPNILEDPSRILDFGNGFVVYGSIIGAVVSGYIYCKKKNKNYLDHIDLAMPSVALAQGFGRIGCFLAGCCYGRQTDAWYGVVFPKGSLAPAGIPLIPTQLFSSGLDFIHALFLFWFASKPRKQGEVTCAYMYFYSIGRFMLEFLRNDYRGEIGFLSTSQFISILFIIITTICLIKIRKAKHN